MRPDFDAYFAGAERLLRRMPTRFGASPFRFNAHETVFRLIPYHWRSDARFFLANNIVEMVIAPFEAIEGRERKTPGLPFREMLEDDVQTIVERAEAVARERGRDYVSATSVTIALGQLADNLRTTSLQIWGPD